MASAPLRRSAKPLVGYSDRLSVAPGETLQFMVSCELDDYDAQLVRLGVPSEEGVGEEIVPSSIDGRYAGASQPLKRGSYVFVPRFRLGQLARGFTLAAFVFPTMVADTRAGLLTIWSDRKTGCGLYVDENGCLELRVGGARVTTLAALRVQRWYFVAATYDRASHAARAVQWPVREEPFEHRSEIEQRVAGCAVGSGEPPLLLAAELVDGTPTSHFNGKLEAPRVWQRALELSELDSIRRDANGFRSIPGLAAAWDFAEDFAGTSVVDRGPHGYAGRVINAPTRAVTGHNWSGQCDAFTRGPTEYGAIHFHDDDLEDAEWTPSLSLSLPVDIASAVYAVKVSQENHEDYIPFFVRAARGGPRAPLLFLVPTFSYLAYQNHHNGAVGNSPRADQPEDDYSAEQHILTLYDRHSDGSGVCYASYLRPLAIPRPAYRSRSMGGVHQLSADLALLRWLEKVGFKYDVATDHDLDARGLELLDGYKAIVTGSHPEYWSAAMLEGVETFLARGGRMAYLGGNGFYWVTSINPARPHIVEVRRGEAGTRTWTSEPGETYHSTTGERGGLWRHRGRAPQRLSGVGFTAWGNGPANPYIRTPESGDPRAAFIFEGVREDEPIGADGDVLGGAAGYEIDRADRRLGTPPHALVVATSRRHDIDFHPVAEELEIGDFPLPAAPDNPVIHADMVFFETGNDGAVFSTGSITWIGSLATNGGDNAVARITANVLRRFCG